MANLDKNIKVVINPKVGTATSVDQWSLYEKNGVYEEPERVSVSKNNYVYSLVFNEGREHPTVEVWTDDGNGDPGIHVMTLDVEDSDYGDDL